MRDEHFERLAGHLSDRDWSDVQIINFAQKIAQSHLLSHESVLGILEYQQEVDEGNEAMKEHDRWAIGRAMVAETFFEDMQEVQDQYDLPDKEGEALDPGFIQQRFEQGL